MYMVMRHGARVLKVFKDGVIALLFWEAWKNIHLEAHEFFSLQRSHFIFADKMPPWYEKVVGFRNAIVRKTIFNDSPCGKSFMFRRFLSAKIAGRIRGPFGAI
jgi:hypothetical protein